MIYCILGMIMLFGNSEANVTSFPKKHISSSLQNIITCDLFSDTHVSCGMYPVSFAAHQKKYIPIEEIPKGIKIFEAILMLPESFLKTSPTILHSFTNLTEIHLVGILDYFQHAEKSTVERREVINRLSDLPNLKLLSLQYWRLDDSQLKLSNKLESVTLQKCHISQLDLTSNKNLVDLNVVGNDLKKMPQLSDPPPPLKRLDLSGNTDLAFGVYDIVNLCHLKYLGVSKFNENFDVTKKYCECVRLKDFMQEFNISGLEFIQCDSSNGAINCIDYPSGGVKEMHKTKCENSQTDKVLEVEMLTLKSWLAQNSGLIGVGLMLVCSALVNVVLAMALYNKSQNIVIEESTPSVFEEEVEV